MNIFKVLASARKGFPEEQASAMLAWLLNPYMEHGLGFTFLDKFLGLIIQDDSGLGDKLKTVLQPILRLDRRGEALDFNMDLEFNAVNSLIDIFLMINRLIFSIENKIRSGSAADPHQLIKQYEGLKTRFPDAEKRFVIFLVPSKTDTRVLPEFENLKKEEMDTNDGKVMIEWRDVRRIIQEILDEDQKSSGTPVYEYVRHTLKAFAASIDDNFEGYPPGTGPNPPPPLRPRKTYQQVKDTGKEGDWVGVQFGLPGLIRDYDQETLGNYAFQYTTENMEGSNGWLPRKVFLEIGGCILRNNYDGIQWQDYIGSLDARTIYRIAKATGTPLFVGIQGGEKALAGMDNATIQGKRWGLLPYQKNKNPQWISKEVFLRILEEKKVFE
jgi:hypothetical protein